MKLDHSLSPYRKITSKWIKDLNVRLYTIKLPEENIGISFFTLIVVMIFYVNTKAKATKTKINT